jgi:hypothetical protein
MHSDTPPSPEDDDFEPEALEVAVAASMGRQYRADSRRFFVDLARLLEMALPGEARVKRAGLFGGDSRPIKALEIDFPDPRNAQNAGRYSLEDAGRGHFVATRTQIVRGITLKNETLTVDNWLSEVAAAISRRASESKAVRDALQRLEM